MTPDPRPRRPALRVPTDALYANMKAAKSGFRRQIDFTVGKSSIGFSAVQVARLSG